MTEQNQAETPARATRPGWHWGLAGVAASAAALALGELVAGLILSVPSLVESVGAWVIDVVPAGVKDLAIALFDTNDKVALVVGIVILSLALGWIVGLIAYRRRALGALIIGAFGLVGALAAARQSDVSLLAAAIAGSSAAVGGIAVLYWLTGRAARADLEPDVGRRRVITGAIGVLGVAVLAASAGRTLLNQTKRVVAARTSALLPQPAEPLAAPTTAHELGIDGLSPAVTPNDVFYRIDTALSVPRVELATWSLEVNGHVEEPLSLSYDDLLDMRSVERWVTLSCVSNRVGGDLVGNARWQGVPLSDILDRAGVTAAGEQIVGRSVDGFTVGFPVEAAFDGRDSLVAFGMNGEPLPFDHGFPVRLVVEGLYGYVSATKWLSEIQLTRWDEFDAYWIPRGWAKQAPIKTASRIDTPRNRANFPAGEKAIAGVAWAPGRGIDRVEVQIDDGPWQEATLSEELSEASWRQWMVAIDWPAGKHAARVRATDGSGTLQDPVYRPPAPDGATGYHEISVTAT